jgi:hypothetical protein
MKGGELSNTFSRSPHGDGRNAEPGVQTLVSNTIDCTNTCSPGSPWLPEEKDLGGRAGTRCSHSKNLADKSGAESPLPRSAAFFLRPAPLLVLSRAARMAQDRRAPVA